MQQEKHTEWYYQWGNYRDNTEFLFFDWIYPRTLDVLNGKRVLDERCNPGDHTRIVGLVTKSITAMDLNTVELAENMQDTITNIDILETNIKSYQTDDSYDVIYCIEVIHHTDSPEATFKNLRKLAKLNGLIIAWCYSEEGNAIKQHIVEPLPKMFYAITVADLSVIYRERHIPSRSYHLTVDSPFFTIL